MNLRELRERSQLSKSFTATKLYCVVRETTINISSEFGNIIELKGIVERHREYGLEPWQDEDDMPLRNIEFSCKVTSEEPDAGVDEEGDAITAQVLYDYPYKEFNASIRISIWEKEDTFRDILQMARASLQDETMKINMKLSTNVSFCELIESKEIDKTWLPINTWDFYFYKNQ